MSRAAASPNLPAAAEVWLATPDAARQLDLAALDDADRAAWAAIRTSRRRQDWASSRALRGAVPAAEQQASSHSHSHGFAALAMAPASVTVGVDLEWLAPRDFRALADIAYSADECAHLASLEDSSGLGSTFYELWTLKEAFAKALQLHLADALKLCRFIDCSGTRRAEIPTTQSWRATVFAPRPQLRLAVVRMHDSEASICEAVNTMEWPLPRTREWPVVVDLVSSGRRAATAC
jgi:phosphopantetheinyl transferase (holo-ACP synthase)